MSFNIHVTADDDEIFVCKSASGLEFSSITDVHSYMYDNENLVEFFGVQPRTKKIIKKKKHLRFSYQYEDITLAEIGGTNLYPINLNNFPDGYCSFIIRDYLLVDGLELRLFSHWLHGMNNIKWTDFSSVSEKRTWLRACLLWECNKTQPNSIINIPGLDILTEEDFYCYIGEAVWGYRGYIGQDLDGFYECLQDAVINFKSKIEFNFIDSMDLFYRKDSFFTEYFISKFKEIISDLGCKVNFK
jgi:hypothetical protein